MLPYKPGTKHRVVQGYGGTMTHTGKNHFSIDFTTGQGTALHATRAGVVAAIKSESKKSGPTDDFLEFANYVIIEHEDDHTPCLLPVSTTGFRSNSIHLQERAGPCQN